MAHALRDWAISEQEKFQSVTYTLYKRQDLGTFPYIHYAYIFSPKVCVWNREHDVHVCIIINVWGCVEIFPVELYEEIFN